MAVKLAPLIVIVELDPFPVTDATVDWKATGLVSVGDTNVTPGADNDPPFTVIEMNPTGLVATEEDWAKAAEPQSSDTNDRESIFVFTL